MSVGADTLALLTRQLEDLIHQDPGKRGLEHVWTDLRTSGDLSTLYTLHNAATSIFSNCKKALVCTGFIIPSVAKPETDGPPGALAIARAIRLLGKEVTLITARGNGPLLRALLEFEKQTYGHDIELIEVPLLREVKDHNDWARSQLQGYDHVISIEILGAATDGGYYNMRGIEASEFNSPIDVLFTLARQEMPNVRLISIGDGGNEIGMGNIYELISKHVPRGQLIGTRVKCDDLLTAGVSNWGGYALACALYLQHRFSSPLSEKLIRILPSPEIEGEQLDEMLIAGAVDGPTCQTERKVDSLPFEDHEALINQMLAICNDPKAVP